MRRRSFLKGAAATSLLLTAAGAWRARERGVFATGEGPAYEPWRDFVIASDHGPLALVRAAILAANPHNSQPWLFHVTDTRIELFANPRRNIGAIDPLLREMHVGVGCALENMLLAAEAHGFTAALTLTPHPADTSHAARIELAPAKRHEPSLYRAIAERHTNRGPYRGEPLSLATRAALSALANGEPDLHVAWFVSASERAQVGKLIIAATEAIVADAQQSHDSAEWSRLSWDEVQKYRDGVTIDATGGGTFLRAAAKWLPPLSAQQNNRYWLEATRNMHVATAAAFGLLAVRNADDIAQRLRAGRLWQRMQLFATVRGLALQPLNQMPERATREQQLGIAPRFGRALHELTGAAGFETLLVFRAGYPMHAARKSPRRPLASVLI